MRWSLIFLAVGLSGCAGDGSGEMDSASTLPDVSAGVAPTTPVEMNVAGAGGSIAPGSSVAPNDPGAASEPEPRICMLATVPGAPRLTLSGEACQQSLALDAMLGTFITVTVSAQDPDRVTRVVLRDDTSLEAARLPQYFDDHALFLDVRFAEPGVPLDGSLALFPLELGLLAACDFGTLSFGPADLEVAITATAPGEIEISLPAIEVVAYTTRYGGPIVVPTCRGEASLVLAGAVEVISDGEE